MTPLDSLDSIIKEWREETRKPYWTDAYTVGRSDARELCAKDVESYAVRERERRQGLEKLRELFENSTNSYPELLRFERACIDYVRSALLNDQPAEQVEGATEKESHEVRDS